MSRRGRGKEGGAGRKENQLRKRKRRRRGGRFCRRGRGEERRKEEQWRKGEEGMEEAIPKAVERYCMTHVHYSTVLTMKELVFYT